MRRLRDVERRTGEERRKEGQGETIIIKREERRLRDVEKKTGKL